MKRMSDLMIRRRSSRLSLSEDWGGSWTGLAASNQSSVKRHTSLYSPPPACEKNPLPATDTSTNPGDESPVSPVILRQLAGEPSVMVRASAPPTSRPLVPRLPDLLQEIVETSIAEDTVTKASDLVTSPKEEFNNNSKQELEKGKEGNKMEEGETSVGKAASLPHQNSQPDTGLVSKRITLFENKHNH